MRNIFVIYKGLRKTEPDLIPFAVRNRGRVERTPRWGHTVISLVIGEELLTH